MQCKTFALLAGLLALASASPCKPRTSSISSPPPTATSPPPDSSSLPPSSVPATSASATIVTPTLPTTGSGSELPAVNASLSLLKIAVGHGLQNYSCVNASAAVKATGALAVLYDITDLYPGTANTGIDAAAFGGLSSSALWAQDLPLNLQNPVVASPGSPSAPNAQAESMYGAMVDAPFTDPAPTLDLSSVLASVAGADAVPFLGHHYFDVNGVPTFDLSAAGLVGSMAKTNNVAAPADADKGVLSTGAVDWLLLNDNGLGISKGVQQVFRVLTAGGVSQTCSDVNAEQGSVPYTALYWFYG